MRVVVGSTNPVKIEAAKTVLGRVLGPADVQVEAVAVGSGVSPQPWGDEETRRGALNRAEAVLQRTGADLAVGFEGGVLEVGGELYTSAWCAVMRRDGVLGLAGGENTLLPPAVVHDLRSGRELGTAIDALIGEKNTKHRGGAIGALTNGYLDRQSAYEHLLILALARFLNPEYYEAR
ncbi:MAG: inosine/xanthosine triphosphatase [Anaerolineae bacterium]